MNGAEVLDIGRSAIWLAIQLSAPVLIVGLVVGVVVGLLQALTQVQEATLVYAPKIIAIFVAAGQPSADGRPDGRLYAPDRGPHRGDVGRPCAAKL